MRKKAHRQAPISSPAPTLGILHQMLRQGMMLPTAWEFRGRSMTDQQVSHSPYQLIPHLAMFLLSLSPSHSIQSTEFPYPIPLQTQIARRAAAIITSCGSHLMNHFAPPPCPLIWLRVFLEPPWNASENLRVQSRLMSGQQVWIISLNSYLAICSFSSLSLVCLHSHDGTCPNPLHSTRSEIPYPCPLHTEVVQIAAAITTSC